MSHSKALKATKAIILKPQIPKKRADSETSYIKTLKVETNLPELSLTDLA